MSDSQAKPSAFSARLATIRRSYFVGRVEPSRSPNGPPLVYHSLRTAEAYRPGERFTLCVTAEQLADWYGPALVGGAP